MSIQGELGITLTSHTHRSKSFNCKIESNRPLRVCELFTGKTIQHTLNMVPLIFSICSKAQSVAAIRAIESAMQTPVSREIESNREALVALESLREQVLRILMDWPSYIKEKPNSANLAYVSMGVNKLLQSLQPKDSLTYPAQEVVVIRPHGQAWQSFSKKLGHMLFSSEPDEWIKRLAKDRASTRDNPFRLWSESTSTQAARFMRWLDSQKWKNAGSSTIPHLPDIDDQALALQLATHQETFVQAPQWSEQCYELSWFSRQQSEANSAITELSIALRQQHGSGIYTRLAARLLEVARLQALLDGYFLKHTHLNEPAASGSGLGHANAARGKLTHYVEVDGLMIERLIILAPTEWNFHPLGVAADSLSHLQHDIQCSRGDITKQAELLIHAIDPCVGYQLSVEIEDHPIGVLH